MVVLADLLRAFGRLGELDDKSIVAGSMFGRVRFVRTWFGAGGSNVVALGLADPVDVHVGERLRLARIATGLPQSKVGEALGISTQQVQKYEKGVNRLGASKLYRLSRLLDVSVGFFFDGMSDATVREGDRPLGEGASTEAGVDARRRDRDVVRLVSAFLKIPDMNLRAELTTFIVALQKSLDPHR